MKKAMTILSLALLLGLGTSLMGVAEAPAESQTNIVTLKGKIISVGTCSQMVLCNGTTVVNLIALPASYNVGDEVKLKGKVGTTSLCPSLNRTVKIGKIALDPC